MSLGVQSEHTSLGNSADKAIVITGKRRRGGNVLLQAGLEEKIHSEVGIHICWDRCAFIERLILSFAHQLIT